MVSSGSHDQLAASAATVHTRRGDASRELLAAAEHAGVVGMDTETSGLDPRTDAVRTVQIFVPGFGTEVVRIGHRGAALHLRHLIDSSEVRKVFHYAVFDLSFLSARYDLMPTNVVCTKVAAKLLNPGQSDEQTLTALTRRYLGVSLDKSQRMSDWGSKLLTDAQLAYAAADVRHLPELFDAMLKDLRGRALAELAQGCWDHIPTRVRLELGGFSDVFAY